MLIFGQPSLTADTAPYWLHLYPPFTNLRDVDIIDPYIIFAVEAERLHGSHFR